MPAAILILVLLLAFSGLARTFRRALKNPEFRVLILIFVVLVIIGTLFYHRYESLSWLDSTYFTIVTMSTVGYGDITPQTDIGKVFTMVYILVGIGILVGVANVLGRQIVEDRMERRSSKGKK